MIESRQKDGNTQTRKFVTVEQTKQIKHEIKIKMRECIMVMICIVLTVKFMCETNELNFFREHK